VVQISIGETHAACCTASGEVYAWGLQATGQSLGIGDTLIQTVSTPTKVLGLEGHFIVKVCCGSVATFALSADGNIFSWGIGRHGVLGHGDESLSLLPFQLIFS